MNRERQSPGRLFFLLTAKERTKENCRCFDAADPRLRSCTPLRTPKRKSEVSAAKRTQYYCPFLTPPSLPPLLSRVFPRTPAGVNGSSVGAAYMPPAPPLSKGGGRAREAGGIPAALPFCLTYPFTSFTSFSPLANARAFSIVVMAMLCNAVRVKNA